MNEEELVACLQELGAKVEKDKWGYFWCDIDADKLLDILSLLKNSGYTFFSTITGIDKPKDGVIELVYHLLHEDEEQRLPFINVRIKVPRDSPVVPSVTKIYPAAILYEMEVYDLLGVKFEGHPRLGRLFLPEEVPEGVHPLRKDWRGSTYRIVEEKGVS